LHRRRGDEHPTEVSGSQPNHSSVLPVANHAAPTGVRTRACLRHATPQRGTPRHCTARHENRTEILHGTTLHRTVFILRYCNLAIPQARKRSILYCIRTCCTLYYDNDIHKYTVAFVCVLVLL
jgi:hypothetical protein